MAFLVPSALLASPPALIKVCDATKHPPMMLVLHDLSNMLEASRHRELAHLCLDSDVAD